MRLWGIRIALTAAAALGCGKSEKSGKQITLQPGSGSAVAAVPDAAPVVADAAFGAVSPTLPTKIVIAGKTTCVLLHDTSVRCWGQNDAGQVGTGATTDVASPVAVPGLTGVKDLVMTATSACALKTDGTVVCWGDKKPPAALPDVAGATRFISSGCVAVADDNAVCWRAAPFVKKPGTPQPVPELAKATAFLDGGLAVFADGSTKIVDRNKKLVAAKLAKAAEYQTHAQDDVFCARFDDGAVRCIGNSRACKLGTQDAIFTPVPSGDGETPYVTDPITLPLPPAKELALDASENLCVVTKENQLTCLDIGDAGRKGCGKVTSLADGVQTMTGTCGLLGDGSINCLMIATERRLMIITAVSGLTGATMLVGGPTHGCALAPAGLHCWGDNDRGQLGRGAADKAKHPEAALVVIQ